MRMVLQSDVTAIWDKDGKSLYFQNSKIDLRKFYTEQMFVLVRTYILRLSYF